MLLYLMLLFLGENIYSSRIYCSSDCEPFFTAFRQYKTFGYNTFSYFRSLLNISFFLYQMAIMFTLYFILRSPLMTRTCQTTTELIKYLSTNKVENDSPVILMSSQKLFALKFNGCLWSNKTTPIANTIKL